VNSARERVLRPAAEWLLSDCRRRKAEEVPPSIRKVLRFKRLPNSAISQVVAAVDGDEPFRKLLAARVSEADVDRAGMLWLTRPRNWEADLATIIGVEERRADAFREIQVEQEAVKNLTTLRESLRDASARIDELTVERKRLAAELDKERTERKQLQGELTAAEATAMQARHGHKEAVRQLKTNEELLLRRNRDQELLVARIRELENANPQPTVDRRGFQQAVAESGRAADAVRTAVGPIEAALGPLRESLAALEVSISALAEPVADAPAVSARPVEPVVPSAARRAPGPARSRRTARETLKLPPGVLDDSSEAAEHLAAAPGAVLLIDGYNVTMHRWIDLPIATQRERLVDLLHTLAARTTLDIEVVFDGDDTAAPAPAGRNLGVRLRFSPSGVEADDVIIERVRSLPSERPVLVASDDRRVQTSVKVSGANVLTAAQLFGLLQ